MEQKENQQADQRIRLHPGPHWKATIHSYNRRPTVLSGLRVTNGSVCFLIAHRPNMQEMCC